MSKYSLAYDRKHPSMKKERQRRYRLALKHDAITAYGGCCCDCGSTNEAVIEFDHVDGQGNKHRSKIFGYGHASPGGWNFYLWLKKAGYPKDLGLVLRCSDCHDERHPERKGKERRGSPAMSHDDTFSDKIPF